MIATNNEVAAWLCLSRAILALLETEEQMRNGSQVHERLVNAMKHLNLSGGRFPGIEGILVEKFKPESIAVGEDAVERVTQTVLDSRLGSIEYKLQLYEQMIVRLQQWQISMDAGRKAALKSLESFKFDAPDKE